MKTRIVASYVKKEGYDEIGDRDVDLDEYAHQQVSSVDAGAALIAAKELNGTGTITEESLGKYGWNIVAEHLVDHGTVYETIQP